MREGFGKSLLRFGDGGADGADDQHLRYAPANGRSDRLYLPESTPKA